MERRRPACRRCRGRHLKCDGDRPCTQCEKAKIECDSSTSNIRFRSYQPRPKPTLTFPPDQEWVGTSEKSELHFVSVSGERTKQRSRKSIARRLSISNYTISNESPSSSRSGESHTNERPSIIQTEPVHHSQEPVYAPSESTETVSPQSTSQDAVHVFANVGYTYTEEQSIYPPQRDKYPIGPLKGLPASASNQAFVTNIEEACLIRHFIDDLAPWFDISDRDHNFCFTVPERAMFCPVLRYAIFTASAGHLTRPSSPHRNSNNVIIYNGLPLPCLRYDSAIRYHDICISHLIQVSKDPSGDFNEDVLAAATILRFFEQIDAPAVGADTGTYLNAIQFIINTQRDKSFYAYQTIGGPTRDQNVHDSPAPSLCHSACLVALRQEIWSACLYQHPFRLPISPYDEKIVFDDTTSEFTWANRILIWCADLLNFCFHRESMDHDETLRRWTEFKRFEERWQENKPPAFKPVYYADPDPNAGIFFPTIWHINSCQTLGEQHIELGRILLAVSDPRIFRIGLGASYVNASLETELRAILRRLCGLGVSNSKFQPALTTAAVGISMCGEYFADPREQKALIDILVNLELKHAWPTETTITALRRAWELRAC